MLATEESLPAAIPIVLAQRKLEAEVSSGSLPPVVQRVLEAVPNGRGNYNSPTNSSRMQRIWPDAGENPS